MAWMMALLQSSLEPAVPPTHWRPGDWSAVVGILTVVCGVVGTVLWALFGWLYFRTMAQEKRRWARAALDAHKCDKETRAEFKLFVCELFADEIKERERVFQQVPDAMRGIEANHDRLRAVEETGIRQGKALQDVMDSHKVIAQLNGTLGAMTDTMRKIGERLARIEGIMEAAPWDGHERRHGGGRRGDE